MSTTSTNTLPSMRAPAHQNCFRSAHGN
jgi:hypothetical protein